MIMLFVNLYCIYFSTKLGFWCLNNQSEEKRLWYFFINIIAAFLNIVVAALSLEKILGL